ncbi:hypothetical protein pb186bvf_005201 [Paramecium bursaria]
MKQGPWLNGWNDLVANLDIFSTCMRLIDVQGTGQNNLVVADKDGRLICYKDTQIAWETRVPTSSSVCLTYFYSEATNPPQPYIAVGSQNCVYIYKVFKAYYKFEIPNVPMYKSEEDAWLTYQKDGDIQLLVITLQKLSKTLSLSYKSQEVLGYEKPEKQKEIADVNKLELSQEDSVTCLDILKKQDDDYSPAQLVIGTELKMIYIIDQDVKVVQKQYLLLGTPTSICVFQEITETSGKIAVLVRQGQIYFIGNEIEPYKVDLSSKPIMMIKQSKYLFTATMDKQVQCFQKQIKKYSLQFQYNILVIESLEFTRDKNIKGLLIGLDNQTIQFYQEQNLISIINLDSDVVAMKFGQFGREDGFLVIVNKKGGIDTKILTRQFKQNQNVFQVNEQNNPLQLPPKTQLALELDERERENAKDILKSYQYDLLRMRLKTAQTYLGILQNDQLAPQLNQDSQIRFSATVEGLGPLFKIFCEVENSGAAIIQKLNITYVIKSNVYKIIQPISELLYLIPKNINKFQFLVRNIHPQGLADQIKIHLFETTQILISATLQMPLSEIE